MRFDLFFRTMTTKTIPYFLSSKNIFLIPIICPYFSAAVPTFEETCRKGGGLVGGFERGAMRLHGPPGTGTSADIHGNPHSVGKPASRQTPAGLVVQVVVVTRVGEQQGGRGGGGGGGGGGVAEDPRHVCACVHACLCVCVCVVSPSAGVAAPAEVVLAVVVPRVVGEVAAVCYPAAAAPCAGECSGCGSFTLSSYDRRFWIF